MVDLGVALKPCVVKSEKARLYGDYLVDIVEAFGHTQGAHRPLAALSRESIGSLSILLLVGTVHCIKPSDPVVAALSESGGQLRNGKMPRGTPSSSFLLKHHNSSSLNHITRGKCCSNPSKIEKSLAARHETYTGRGFQRGKLAIFGMQKHLP